MLLITKTSYDFFVISPQVSRDGLGLNLESRDHISLCLCRKTTALVGLVAYKWPVDSISKIGYKRISSASTKTSEQIDTVLQARETITRAWAADRAWQWCEAAYGTEMATFTKDIARSTERQWRIQEGDNPAHPVRQSGHKLWVWYKA